MFAEFENDIQKDGAYIIYSWKKDYATMIYTGTNEELAAKMHKKYDESNFFESIIIKYKSRNAN